MRFFWDKAKEAHALAAEAQVEEQKRKPLKKGVAGFANLSVYKENYKPFLVANGWGVGGRLMTKNSWQ